MNANNQLLFTACATCGKRVTEDSIHTCLPQLKELTNEEIKSVWEKMVCSVHMTSAELNFARAILRKARGDV